MGGPVVGVAADFVRHWVTGQKIIHFHQGGYTFFPNNIFIGIEIHLVQPDHATLFRPARLIWQPLHRLESASDRVFSI